MQLEPCVQCRRHVDRESMRCPFCDASRGAAFSSRIVAQAGRVSRAAVFAGAAACGSAAPVHHAPPPPPPPDPVLVQQFATAPPPAPGKASVRGFVRIDGRPLTGVKVFAQQSSGPRPDGTPQFTTTSGTKGEYEFVDLEPGQWFLAVDYEMPRYRPQDYVQPHQDTVKVEPDQNLRWDLALVTPSPPPPDRGPCCKPYGAPPARRRVV